MREMKGSGIEWIGDIPVGWEIRRVKQLPDKTVKDCYVDGDWIELPDITDNGIRYLTTGNIGDGKFKEQGNGFISLETFDRLKCKYAYPNDLIISRLNAPYGRSCILPDFFPEYVIAVDNVILRTKADKKYISFVTQCSGYQYSVEDLAKGTTMKRISRTNLGNIAVPYPPLFEQHRISAYLDTKCEKIDSVIARQQEVIEKLKSYKLSVITEAVTKGLNPDVRMKDSGVEWIGLMPNKWSCTKIRNIGKTYSGATPLRDKEDVYFNNANIRWVRTLDLTDWVVEDTSEKITDLALCNSSCSIMPINTVCIAMYGGAGTIGKCGILKKECATNQAVCSVICNSSMNSYYFLFQLLALKKYWMKYAVGTRKDPNISQDTVGRMCVLVPPLEEQQQIADYLDKKCSAIDSAIAKKQAIIEKLTAYKKSLIYEVVTGKREVKGSDKLTDGVYAVFISPDVKSYAESLLFHKIINMAGKNLKGRTHLMKIFHAVELVIGFDFGTQYIRHTHGPYSDKIESLEKYLIDKGWLSVKKGNRIEYSILDSSAYETDYNKYFKNYDSDIINIVNCFLTMKRTSKAEKFATLLASWNDFIIDGVEPSDEMIINDVMTNWTENKANTDKETWQGILNHIKQSKIVPRGYGKHTIKKEN